MLYLIAFNNEINNSVSLLFMYHWKILILCLLQRWCSKGLCCMIAGTGKEENRNNLYSGQRASFAQPSGLCLTQSRNGSEKSLYIADSESSSVRRMFLDPMGKYKVLNVAGGSPDPTVSFFSC